MTSCSCPPARTVWSTSGVYHRSPVRPTSSSKKPGNVPPFKLHAPSPLENGQVSLHSRKLRFVRASYYLCDLMIWCPHSYLHSSQGDTADGRIRAFDDHEESVYAVAWSAYDAWVFASLSYDGRVVVNHVPQTEKYKILL